MPEGTPDAAAGSTADGGPTGDGQQQATYTPPATQADLDRIIGERLARDRAKFADYDTLKAKAAEHDKLVQASKSDQERLEERASAAESRIGPLELENAKLAVALEKGLTAADAKRLVGSTREELEADAEQFLRDHPQKQTRTPDLRVAAGQRPPAQQVGNADDWIRRMAGRGQ